jgi:hypothetical protein
MPSAYDFRINCAQDWTPNIDLQRQAATTGDYEAYDGVTGITLLLSAARGSSTPIHASLSKSASERTEKPGRVFATFDVDDLQTHLVTGPPSYLGLKIWLNVFKDGEIFYEAFLCLVVTDRLGI